MTSACAIQHMRADESRASGDGATPKMGACFGKRERECWIVCGDTKQKTKDSRQRTAALRANSLSLEHTKARLVSDGPPDTGISRSTAENLRIKRLQYIKPYASHPHTQKKTTPKPQIRNRKQISSLDIKADPRYRTSRIRSHNLPVHWKLLLQHTQRPPSSRTTAPYPSRARRLETYVSKPVATLISKLGCLA